MDQLKSMSQMDLSVEGLKVEVQRLLHGQRESLVKATMFQGFLCFPFGITAFVCAGTANAGFNVVMTAFAMLIFSCGSYYSLQVNPSRTALTVGFILGCSTMLCLILLMTAIFWGQLANCEAIAEDISQYSCDRPTGYSAISFFSSLMFVVQVLYTYGIFIWRDELMDLQDSPRYNKLPLNSMHLESSASGFDDQLRPSTDL